MRFLEALSPLRWFAADVPKPLPAERRRPLPK